MSDSSDDDVPLSMLASRSDPVPKKSVKKKIKKKPTPVIESSSDEDDNMSLAELSKLQKKKKPAASKKKKKPAASKKKKKSTDTKKRARSSDKSSKPAKKKNKTTTSKKKSNLQGYSADTEKEYKTSIDDFKDGVGHSRKVVMSEPVKLQLSLAVLCRWWYVLEWPSNTGPDPGNDYIEMAGSPGVYVGINNEVVGKIIDTRDHQSPNKPSLGNMMTKNCSELVELWTGALVKQLAEMKDRNDDYRCGNSNKAGFIKVLENELKHAKALDAAKLQKKSDSQDKKKAKKKR